MSRVLFQAGYISNHKVSTMLVTNLTVVFLVTIQLIDTVVLQHKIVVKLFLINL